MTLTSVQIDFFLEFKTRFERPRYGTDTYLPASGAFRPYGYHRPVRARIQRIPSGVLSISSRIGYQPGLCSIPRAGKIIYFRITGAHALRLISRTGKRVWRCPL